MQVKFTIPGDPQGKGRPRATTFKGHIHVFTPKKTADYESTIKAIARMTDDSRADFDGAVRVEITAFYGIPKAWSDKKRNAAELWQYYPIKKPDIDNVAKAVLDAINGVLFKDDKQVCDLSIRKRYSRNPRVEVTVKYTI